MNLLELARKAAQAYLRHAYPDTPPEAARDKVQKLGSLTTESALFDLPELEKEGGRYFLRLGNVRYPHMKLAFTLDGGQPQFYVDAHDAHFNLPPNTPGFDKLLELREYNRGLKQTIENDWDRHGVPVFGRAKQQLLHHKICQGMRVLAIDDEPQILDMLYIIVASLGAKLYRAESAAEAREAIARHGAPHVILCDIMMREESGYEFVAWLKQQRLNAPVYYLTGLSLDQVDREGVEGVLQKPFSAKSVMSILKKHYKPAA